MGTRPGRRWSHTRPSDVDVLLVHGLQRRTVMSDAGVGSEVSNINIILNDQAGPVLPEFGEITTDSFQPRNYEGVHSFSRWGTIHRPAHQTIGPCGLQRDAPQRLLEALRLRR